jgi:kynurenine formamidase
MSLKIIDLTHLITENAPTWDNSCGFHLKTLYDYQEENDQISFKVQSVTINCGIGTHIDAPAHCFKHLPTIDQLSIEDLIQTGYLIDISDRMSEDNCLTASDILQFEDQYGHILENSCVLINTGWHTYWNQAEAYHNNYRFPYIEAAAAEILMQRRIKAVGIDTLSPDRPDSGYPVHNMLLANEVLIIENVGNLQELSTNQFTVTIAPLKIQNATESPVRMWATVTTY